MKRFALIGLAGYIAPRHLQAIKETGNNLLAALDPADSVGIIDTYFPEADFFTEPERFDRHLDKLRRKANQAIDYVSICSPNYLHDAHIRMALRNGAHAICEKPIVLNPWNLDSLEEIENETGKQIFTILQLRFHPAIIALKEKLEMSSAKMHEIDLRYITPRGKWYDYSWKGNSEKSGGIATNIGIHFFDILIWIFGPLINFELKINHPKQLGGILNLERARVNWYLSIDSNDLPDDTQTSYRVLKVDGEEVEFSSGFTQLHTLNYEAILGGYGHRIADARAALDLVHQIRNCR